MVRIIPMRASNSYVGDMPIVIFKKLASVVVLMGLSEKGQVFVERILTVAGTLKERAKNTLGYLAACFKAYTAHS